MNIEKKNSVALRACKISGKIEFSHHGFVMAFSYAESKEKPRTRRGDKIIT